MNKDLKDTLIQTMFKALYHEGYNASNLNALLQDAGTSKGGLYHHFGSKKELALESIRLVISDFIHYYWEVGLAKDTNPINALDHLLKELPNTHILDDLLFDFQYGCPLDTLIQEMSGVDNDFNLLLNSLFNDWVKVVIAAFERAKKTGIIQDNIDIKSIAEFIVASIEGCLTVSKVRRCANSYIECTDTLIRFLRSIENKTK